MRILLTGAKGNFGREFMAQATHHIEELNRESWADLDIKLASGIDVVIHAASDLRSNIALSPSLWMDSNVMATGRLLEAAGKFRIPRFIFLSSCAVYGEDMRTREDEHSCPISVNGMGKLMNEKAVAEYCFAHGIKFEILRIFNMYGGVDHFSILSHIQRALERGTPFTLNNSGIAQRDFVHVSDVATIVLRLLDKHVPYTHLNIGTGIATKISTLVDLVVRRFPELAIRHARVTEAEYSRADITRLLSLMDVNFLRVEDYVMNRFMTPSCNQRSAS